MIRQLVAFPILILAVIAQTAVIGRIPLLSGFADLTLLIVAAWSLQERVTTAWHWAVLGALLTAFTSGVPWIVYLAGYLITAGLAQALQRRLWQAPLLAMFTVTFAGTLTLHFLMYAVLRVLGAPLPLADSFMLVTVPSLLLNLLLAIAIYPLIRDLAAWVHPLETY